VSLGDNSKDEKSEVDVEELIEQVLSSGSKTPRELSQTVMTKIEYDKRTYYRHLKKLLKRKIVAEVAEQDENGRVKKKYALRSNAQPSSNSPTLPVCKEDEEEREEIVPSRKLLELAAWLRREPDDWPSFRIVRKAMLAEQVYGRLVPSIEPPSEDPDRYKLVWSDEAVQYLKLKKAESPRFFELKSVLEAVRPSSGLKIKHDGEVFLGACSMPMVTGYVGYYTGMQSLRHVGQPNVIEPIEEPKSFCVAVSEKPEGITVVKMETQKGKLNNKWISGIAKHLKAKRALSVNYKCLREDYKRDLLMKLRDVVDQRRLQISNRHTTLIEDLTEYSYKKTSNGYLLALALAVKATSKS
jgi:hypothetical protein